MINTSARVVIEPGGFYFNDDKDEIYTLLGSCVAVTLWHPSLKLAGMCHVILPSKENNQSNTRFAGCAIDQFIKQVSFFGTTPEDYQVGIYGGSNMFPSIVKKEKYQIGKKNITEVERLLIENRFQIKFKDVGGTSARKLTLNRLNGNILLQYVDQES